MLKNIITALRPAPIPCKLKGPLYKTSGDNIVKNNRHCVGDFGIKCNNNGAIKFTTSGVFTACIKIPTLDNKIITLVDL